MNTPQQTGKQPVSIYTFKLIRSALSILFMSMPMGADAGSFFGFGKPHDNLAKARLAYSVTPGKPGASTEQVEVAMSGAEYLTKLRRIDTYQNEVLNESCLIRPEEFFDIWNLATKYRLANFRPEEIADRSFDFGSRTLEIEWQTKEETEIHANKVSWDNPISNGKAIERLSEALAGVASKCAPNDRLYYFGN